MTSCGYNMAGNEQRRVRCEHGDDDRQRDEYRIVQACIQQAAIGGRNDKMQKFEQWSVQTR